MIGVPHEIKGESPIAYSILKSDIKPDSEEKIRAELVSLVRNKLAKFAAPGQIIFVPGLPKTRSGKIMRRILRKISNNQTDEIGDVTTLSDPSIVDILIQKCKSTYTNLDVPFLNHIFQRLDAKQHKNEKNHINTYYMNSATFRLRHQYDSS